MVSMNLKMSSQIFSEIAEKCPNLEGVNFLMICNGDSALGAADGYQMDIRANPNQIDEETLSTLNGIALKRNLIVAKATETIILFSPKQKTTKKLA